MSEAETVIEVGEADFEARVIARSRTVPVVVDFWAAWCGPCRTLGPVLEELAQEDSGRWILAKVDVDANPGLAQAWGVQGIPAVKAFVGGEPVDEFTGALPKAAVRQFLDRIAPSPVDELAREAAEAGHAGDPAREEALWAQVLELRPDHHLARVRRARLLVGRGARGEARAELALVPVESDLREEADRLEALLGWADRVEARGGLAAIRERAGETPDDAGARFELGCALSIAGDFEGALGEFLEVVRRDREFEDDAGRRAMIAVFGLLGDHHPLTGEWRSRLSSLLF